MKEKRRREKKIDKLCKTMCVFLYGDPKFHAVRYLDRPSTGPKTREKHRRHLFSPSLSLSLSLSLSFLFYFSKKIKEDEGEEEE